MAKQITESEKLIQLTLNRKYMELEQKDKQIKQLEREKSCLEMQVKEYKEIVSDLCVQINRLVLKQKQDD